MRRILVLIPFACAFAMIFGGYWTYAGLGMVLAGNKLGAVFLLYGLGGLLIGGTLWKAYRDYRKQLRQAGAAAPTENAGTG